MPLQREDVAKALGGDKGGREALAFEHRVGGDRRAMREVVDSQARASRLATSALKAPSSGLARHARYLRNADTCQRLSRRDP